MKKALALLLALVVSLSLIACGGRNDTPKQDTTEPPTTIEPESLMFKVGETVHGKTGNVTVTSVEFVDKIENGLFFNMWSPGNEQSYQDVTAEDGYSIVKISYRFEYTAKSSGDMCLAFSLDYDNGYIFEGNSINHAVPKSEIGVGFERKYAFNQDLLFTVSDPLAFQEKESCCYVFVNNAVIEHPEKDFVLNVGIPTQTLNIFELGSISAESFDYDTFVFDLADVSREVTVIKTAEEPLYQEAIALMAENRYKEAGDILNTILGYENAEDLYIECCIKTYAHDVPDNLEEKFVTLQGAEISSHIIGAWNNLSGETWEFFEDGTVDKGASTVIGQAEKRIIWNWEIDGDLLVLSNDYDTYRLVVKVPFDGGLVLYHGESRTNYQGEDMLGTEYASMWKAE